MQVYCLWTYTHHFNYNTLCFPLECGAAVEDLPYLEILCVSDTTSNILENFATAGGTPDEEEASATKSPQSCEKQGSLIALAWSKSPEDDTDYEAEAADRETSQSQCGKNSLKTRDIHSTADQTQCAETAAENCNEELNLTPFQSGSTGHPATQLAHQQYSVEQVLSAMYSICILADTVLLLLYFIRFLPFYILIS